MKTNQMKISHIIFIFYCSIVAACSQNDVNPIIESKEYEPCCGTSKPIVHKYDVFFVSNPNVFTPNSDGINDLFYPQLSSEKIYINGFFIKTMTDSVIFFRPYVDYANPFGAGWNGQIEPNQFNPDIKIREYAGQFKYSYQVIYPATENLPGASYDIEGTACLIRCGEKAQVFQTKEGCFFPVQFSNGNFDSKISNKETDCFK